MMTFQNRFLTNCLVLTILAFLAACGNNNANESTAKADTQKTADTPVVVQKNTTPEVPQKTDDPALVMQSFKTFPPEVEGCMCYFSSDSAAFKAREYIYADNYDKLSFLKINGNWVKFTQTATKELDKNTTINEAKSEDYEMTLEIKNGPQKGEEVWLKVGIITLKHKNGNMVKKSFFGECGC